MAKTGSIGAASADLRRPNARVGSLLVVWLAVVGVACARPQAKPDSLVADAQLDTAHARATADEDALSTGSQAATADTPDGADTADTPEPADSADSADVAATLLDELAIDATEPADAATDLVADAGVDAPVDPTPDTAQADALAGGDSAAVASTGILRFVVLSDPQMGMTPTPDGSDLDMKYFAQALGQIGALNPPASFALNCGDMVQLALPGQWADYASVAAKMPLPHHEVMGNHDGWSQAGLDHWRKTLGKQDYYAFTDGNALFVALNSYFLKNPAALPAETAAQKAFLAATLAANATVPNKFLFFHMPLFTQSANEAEDYWNLPAPERQYLLALIEQYAITAVFTGHYHRTDLLNYKDTVLLTTGPIAQPMGTNSDGTPAARGFFVVDLDRATGKLVLQNQLLGAIGP